MYDQSHYYSVGCKFYYGLRGVNGGAVMNNVKMIGFNTQPCRIPGRRCVWGGMFTYSHLLWTMRKSIIYEHWEGPRPKMSSLLTSLCEMTVKCGAKVHKKHPHIIVILFLCQGCVGSCCDGILCGAFCSVCKLIFIHI